MPGLNLAIFVTILGLINEWRCRYSTNVLYRCIISLFNDKNKISEAYRDRSCICALLDPEIIGYLGNLISTPDSLPGRIAYQAVEVSKISIKENIGVTVYFDIHLLLNIISRQDFCKKIQLFRLGLRLL